MANTWPRTPRGAIRVEDGVAECVCVRACVCACVWLYRRRDQVTGLWSVIHIHHCHPFTYLHHRHLSTPLSPIYTTVNHQHNSHPSLLLSPIYTPTPLSPLSPIYTTVTPHYNLSCPTVSTDLSRPDPVAFGQHRLQTEVPQTFLPSTSLSPVYTTVTHLHHCHTHYNLFPGPTVSIDLSRPDPVTIRQHRLQTEVPQTFLPSTPLSPMYATHPSIPLSPIYTTVTHLHHCHPSTLMSPIYITVTPHYNLSPLSPIYTYATHLHHCHTTLQSLSWSNSLHRP